MQCWGITVAETCTVARNMSHAVARRTPSKVMKIQELPARLQHSFFVSEKGTLNAHRTYQTNMHKTYILDLLSNC